MFSLRSDESPVYCSVVLPLKIPTISKVLACEASLYASSLNNERLILSCSFQLFFFASSLCTRILYLSPSFRARPSSTKKAPLRNSRFLLLSVTAWMDTRLFSSCGKSSRWIFCAPSKTLPLVSFAVPAYSAVISSILLIESKELRSFI